MLVDKIIFPAISDVALDYKDVQVFALGDGIDLMTQWPNSNYHTKLGLPFTGHIWLALTLLWIAKSRKLIRTLFFYQLVLFVLMPFAGWLILEGYGWVAMATNIHDKVYKKLFVIVGLLAIRSLILRRKLE